MGKEKKKAMRKAKKDARQLKIEQLCALLDEKGVWYRTGYDGTIGINICNVKNPIHSYGDWVGDDTDYEEGDAEQQALFQELEQFSDILYYRDCEECVGCGDW